MNDHYTAWQILQAALRLDLIEAYIAREITLAELAQSAELSTRQCIRLVKRYRESGPAGLLSRRQGKPGNHQLQADIRAQALQLIRSRGRGMSPSAVWRILTIEYGIQISKETVRKMMIAEKSWHPRPFSNLTQTKEGIAQTLHRRHLSIVLSTTFQHWLDNM